VIWPRSAILHSAPASIVDGIFGLIVSTADRIATRTSAKRSTWARVDRVLQDVDLVGQGRGDVDGRVGDDQGLAWPGTSMMKQ